MYIQSNNGRGIFALTEKCKSTVIYHLYFDQLYISNHVNIYEYFGLLNWTLYTTGWVKNTDTLKMSLFRLLYSIFLNFFSQDRFPLYKRRKMSGQSPLKVPRGLRYLIFRFGEAFWKSIHSRQQLFWKLRCLCLTF